MSSALISNNGVRYVGERPSLRDPSMVLIYCNELFPSTAGNIVIQREELKDEATSGSGQDTKLDIKLHMERNPLKSVVVDGVLQPQ